MLSVKYKKAMIAFALILGLVLFIQQIAYAYENNDFKLEGTYSNGKQSFDWISFNNDGPNTFRLYYMVEGSQEEDRGTFKKISDRKYILSSPYLGNVEVTSYKKFPNTVGFTMESGKAKCDFVQVSTIPGQIESSVDEKSKIYTSDDIKSAIETMVVNGNMLTLGIVWSCSSKLCDNLFATVCELGGGLICLFQ